MQHTCMNVTLYGWTFNFHKVVRQQNSGAVEDFILPYSALYLQIQKWKNYWNRSTFAKVIVKIKVAPFLWPTVYIITPMLEYCKFAMAKKWPLRFYFLFLNKSTLHVGLVRLPAIARCMMKNFMRDFRPADDVTMDSKMAELATVMATNSATRKAICGVCSRHMNNQIN